MRKKSRMILFLVTTGLIIVAAVTLIGCGYKSEHSINIDGQQFPLVKLPKGHIFYFVYEKDGMKVCTRGPGDEKGPGQYFLFELSSETGKLKPVIVFEEQ